MPWQQLLDLSGEDLHSQLMFAIKTVGTLIVVETRGL